MSQPINHTLTPAGWWIPGNLSPEIGDQAIQDGLNRTTRSLILLHIGDALAIGREGTLIVEDRASGDRVLDATRLPVFAYAPPLHPKDLGDPIFKIAHGVTYAYVMGAMAHGITSVDMVEEAGRAGMVGFFGAAGLPLNDISSAIDRLKRQNEGFPYGFNLIYSPNDPELETATVALYLKHGIRLISASAFMDMTLPLVYYRVKGIHQLPNNEIVCPNKVIAKVSRVEVAKKFFSPPPQKFLNQLLEKGMITREEASLAECIPMAEDLTAEADSGGHTDNRPALSLLPTMLALRNKMQTDHRYPRPLCVGLGGGIATPESAAAAFTMGAAYILTGSVNQACIEAGTSQTVRQMLVEAGQADVTMAPAADMFELGVKVQVLKRGTMFALRAAKLYDLYTTYDSLDNIPDAQKEILERDFFRCTLDQEWRQSRRFFSERDPGQIDRAERDAKHKMALVFRSYLGKSSKWANSGDPTRKIDYQIWCGPSIGAFNEWVKGSFLEKPEHRRVAVVAMNLLFGASVTIRLAWIRSQGVALPPHIGFMKPRTLSEIRAFLENGSSHDKKVTDSAEIGPLRNHQR